jgi:hypothetical protein
MYGARGVLRALGQVSCIMPTTVDHDTLVTVRTDEVAVTRGVTARYLCPAALGVEEIDEFDQISSIQIVKTVYSKRPGLNIPRSQHVCSCLINLAEIQYLERSLVRIPYSDWLFQGYLFSRLSISDSSLDSIAGF